jgi:hypothetical protein
MNRMESIAHKLDELLEYTSSGNCFNYLILLQPIEWLRPLHRPRRL